MNVEYFSFPTRKSRAQFVANRFPHYLNGIVVDVGCFEADLKTFLQESNYTGVDIVGNPDIQLNLETADRLPFDDYHPDCVVCTDVLEHLDNFHFMLNEIIRIAKQHIIISLPNCWCGARKPIERGKGKFAHYGLPYEKPLDRHKWFFSLSECHEFFQEVEKNKPVEIVEVFATEKPRNPIVQWVRKLRYPSQPRYLNRYANTLWIVLKKHPMSDS